jgi:hypothetical protein
MNSLLAACLLLLITTCAAAAFCSEPSPPLRPPNAPSGFEKPNTPFCLSGYRYTRSHSCDEWELNNYIKDINEYIEKLNNYVSEANTFAINAADFAQSASRYAKCERDEVVSEID